MADEQIRIDITAEDDASRVVDKVADKVEDLERQSPTELEVTADTDQAERGIKDVADDAEALSRQDTEILLRAKIDDAKAGLKALRDDLDQTGDAADTTARRLDDVDRGGGSNLRGQAIADLTGPLGEASSAASDFAGVFDGIGDIAEAAAAKVGIQAAGMATAIGGIGVAVAGAAALWSYFGQRQAEAKRKLEELIAKHRDLRDAIEAGKFEDAAEALIEQYDKAYDAGQRLGVSVQDVTKYLTGQANEIPGWRQRQDELAEATYAAAGRSEEARAAAQAEWEERQRLATELTNQRDKYVDVNGALDEQEARARDVAGALSGLATDTDRAKSAQERLERQADRTRNAIDKIEGALDMQQAFLNFQNGMQTALDNVSSGAGNTAQDVLDIKQSIVDVAEAAKLTPIEIRSLLEKVDRGDLAGVKADVEGYYARNQAQIDTQLRPPSASEMAAMNRQIRDGIGIVFLTAALQNLRSGAYG